MTERLQLTVIYEDVEEGWVQAQIEEFPQVVTAGPSAEEAKSLVLDALREFLLALGQQGVPAEAGSRARREPIEISLSA